jgi:putative SOS response-associated peptidase YedK
MCGRFSLAIEQMQIEQRFHATFTEPFKPRYNAAPSQRLPGIFNYNPRKLVFTHWGMKPSRIRKLSKRNALINVRFETLRDTLTFREDLEERRCLIPADGFYELATVPGGRKAPFRITREDGQLF